MKYLLILIVCLCAFDFRASPNVSSTGLTLRISDYTPIYDRDGTNVSIVTVAVTGAVQGRIDSLYLSTNLIDWTLNQSVPAFGSSYHLLVYLPTNLPAAYFRMSEAAP